MHSKLVLVLVQIVIVTARPDGAPVGACVNMAPNHGTSAQQVTSPYTITAGARNVVSGGKVIFTVGGSQTYRGILLQARTGSNTIPAGEWAPPNNHKLLCCSGQQALTHSNRNDKTLPASFQWTAPQVTSNTTYVIYMTIVQVKKTYWVKVGSGDVLVRPSTTAPANPPAMRQATCAASNIEGYKGFYLVSLIMSIVFMVLGQN